MLQVHLQKMAFETTWWNAYGITTSTYAIGYNALFCWLVF